VEIALAALDCAVGVPLVSRFVPQGGRSDASCGCGELLNANATTLFIEEVLAGDELKLGFNNRRRDLELQTSLFSPCMERYIRPRAKRMRNTVGSALATPTWSGSFPIPHIKSNTIKTPVATSQVAPTILESLGMDADALKSVRVEHTEELPGLHH
jgi:hypothetical protein